MCQNFSFQGEIYKRKSPGSREVYMKPGGEKKMFHFCSLPPLTYNPSFVLWWRKHRTINVCLECLQKRDSHVYLNHRPKLFALEILVRQCYRVQQSRQSGLSSKAYLEKHKHEHIWIGFFLKVMHYLKVKGAVCMYECANILEFFCDKLCSLDANIHFHCYDFHYVPFYRRREARCLGNVLKTSMYN